MSEQRHLHSVDAETGELVGSRGCDRCEDVAVEDVENLERRCRKLERQIREMQRDRDKEREGDPERVLIEELFGVWKSATGHSNSMLGADRHDSIHAALKLCRNAHGQERGQEIVRLALEGIGAFPYVVNGQRVASGTTAQRHDRIGLALVGSENIERFANLGHQARRAA